MSLSVRDCSPFDIPLSNADTAWLSRLANASRHGDMVVRLEDGREDEPVVRCEADGTWWAGRYVGSLVFEGRRLDIRPRFGEKTLLSWFDGAFNLALAETQGELVDHSWFVPWLLASIWSRAFTVAARHGLPALKADVLETGLSIKGRLDVPYTVHLRAAGNPGAASFRREKSLDNPISAVIVAAYVELDKWIGKQRGIKWLPERIKVLLPHLISAVGSRPRTPTLVEIDRVRLTPITAGFRPLAELSLRIATGRGLIGDASSGGECKGVLLDVAELWELYMLAVFRRAWPNMNVAHGANDPSSLALLQNDNGALLGTLKPDALVEHEGKTVAIVDAKYKRLWPTKWNAAPQREDMYQLAAYLGRHAIAGNRIQGVLAYPFDPDAPAIPPVELGNPWWLDDMKQVRFLSLPHNIDDAVCKIRADVPFQKDELSLRSREN